MNCQVKDDLVSQLIALNNKLDLLKSWIWSTWRTKNAQKCKNDVSAYTPRSSTTGEGTRRQAMPRREKGLASRPKWLGKRTSA